ncbi:MAG: hypothetical protein M1827_001691 [Pycnora praestabilis]|nr:MAG: hypothetical protein M1827_001691 [Pycnora praestabilis]
MAPDELGLPIHSLTHPKQPSRPARAGSPFMTTPSNESLRGESTAGCASPRIQISHDRDIDSRHGGPHLRYVRARSATGFLSRSLSLSSMGSSRSRQDPRVLRSGSRTPESEEANRMMGAHDEEFTIEELRDSDISYGSDIEVLHPDQYEDVGSARDKLENFGEDADKVDEQRNNILSGLQMLHCDDDEGPPGPTYEHDRRYRKKKKRWSAGIFKRTHSQSIGSDSDSNDSEILDAQDIGSSARRMRRRVKGPGDRNSSIFDDSMIVAEIEESKTGDKAAAPGVFYDINDRNGESVPLHTAEISREDPMEMDSNRNEQKFF